MKQPRPRAAFSWQNASAFAAFKHRHQVRKDGRTPYYSHVARVALTVAGVFECADEVALATAFLHDTIEDTTTDYDDIADFFGHDVARCVAALTKNMAVPEAQREDEYFDRLRQAPWQARVVKLADVLDNLCDVATYPAAERAKHKRKTIARAKHALELVREDDPPAIHRAAAAVKRLLKSA